MFTPPDDLFRTGRPLVVFVIPEAFTPICTQTMRSAAALRSGIPMAVMSTDNQAALERWAAEAGVRNLRMVGDNDREFIVLPHRGTYVYDEHRSLLGVIHTEDVQAHFAALTMLLPALREEQMKREAEARAAAEAATAEAEPNDLPVLSDEAAAAAALERAAARQAASAT